MAEQKPLPPLAPTEAWRKLVEQTCGPEDQPETRDERKDEDYAEEEEGDE